MHPIVLMSSEGGGDNSFTKYHGELPTIMNDCLFNNTLVYYNNKGSFLA